MALDGGQRLRLLRRLHDVLGAEQADTLMAYLPPGGAAELATRGDLAGMRTEMADLRTELKGEMAGLRVEMADLRTDLKTELSDLRTELKTEVAGLRADVNTGMAGLRAELHATVTGSTRMVFIGLGGFMVAWGGALIAAIRVH